MRSEWDVEEIRQELEEILLKYENFADLKPFHAELIEDLIDYVCSQMSAVC